MHFIYDNEKDKTLFKKMRNDVYYDAAEIGNYKLIERGSKIKTIKQDDQEQALTITYKIVHYINIFSGYKINTMIVEFMQDEYKNLWLFNCSFISYEKIDALTDVESIYLRKMSRVIPSFDYEVRKKRSHTMPFRNSTDVKTNENLSPKVVLRGLSIEQEILENFSPNRNRTIRFKDQIKNFENDDSLSPNNYDKRKKEKIKETLENVPRSTSIFFEKSSPLQYSPKISKSPNENLEKKLKINQIRGKNFYFMKKNLLNKGKKINFQKSYLLKTERINHTQRFLSHEKVQNSVLYYHGNYIKNKHDFELLKNNSAFSCRKKKTNTLPSLLFDQNFNLSHL